MSSLIAEAVNAICATFNEYDIKVKMGLFGHNLEISFTPHCLVDRIQYTNLDLKPRT